MATSAWALIVHGGATTIADAERDAYRRGCEAAAAVGRDVLVDGGSAVDAVVAAVHVLESDPTFNAGIGAALNADGRVQRDAAVMDGETLDVGAVAAVEGVVHPVDFAASLLRDEEVLLVGPGAERVAAERGFTGPPPDGAEPPGSGTHNTVGCVALDREGHLAAAVSTGGLDGSRPGRVGDSPLPGGGFFADDEIGAVVLSGSGEQIARVSLAAWVEHRLRDGLVPQKASAQALDRLTRVGGEAGLIAIDRDGRMGWAYSSPDFALAHVTDGEPVHAYTRPPHPTTDSEEEPR